jgi:4-hydroxyphenylpyruvate dioxygenase
MGCRSAAKYACNSIKSAKMTVKDASSVDEIVKKDQVDRRYLGFHHLELWVGNAFQAASFFIARMGFEPVAYRGLETGCRTVATHVVRQGQILIAFSSALEPGNREIGDHHTQHGDGVRDVSFLVRDCRAVFDDAVRNGASIVREPWESSDEHGAVLMATIASYGDTVHTFVERRGYAGPFLPGFAAAGADRDPLIDITPSPRLEFIDHVVGNQPFDGMEAVCAWYSQVP